MKKTHIHIEYSKTKTLVKFPNLCETPSMFVLYFILLPNFVQLSLALLWFWELLTLLCLFESVFLNVLFVLLPNFLDSIFKVLKMAFTFYDEYKTDSWKKVTNLDAKETGKWSKTRSSFLFFIYSLEKRKVS